MPLLSRPLGLLFFLLLANTGWAELVLTIGPALTTVNRPLPGATSSITLTVFLNANSGTESVWGYSIPVDLSPPIGTESPTGLTITGATLRTDFAGLDTAPNFNPSEGDLFVVDGALNLQPLQFSTTPTPIFDFNITVDSSATERDYQVDVVRGALLSLDRNLTNTAIFGAPAVIRVTAVPEPCGCSAFLYFIALTTIRRRKLSGLV